MNRKFYLVVLTVITVAAISIANVNAQDLKALLPELLQTHDLIKVYQERKTMAEHLLRQKRADYYPLLNLNTDGGYQAMEREYFRDTDMWRAYFNLRATQLITDFGLTTNTIGKSQVVLERSEHELETVKQQVLIEGVSAYIDVIRSRERLKYARDSENNIKKQTRMEDARVQKGAGLPSDVLQAKAYLARSQALRVHFQGTESNSRSHFQSSPILQTCQARRICMRILLLFRVLDSAKLFRNRMGIAC